LTYIFDIFVELVCCIKEINFSELKSWCELSGITLSQFERKTLMMMFLEYRNYIVIYNKEPNKINPLEVEKEGKKKEFNHNLIQKLKVLSLRAESR